MGKPFNKKEFLYLRRKLRGQSVKCEQIMWYKLRNRNINGYKFRRQYGIGKYIVDFYCPELKLVIEIDGATHTNEIELKNDGERQKSIESLGIRVVRFWNDDVYNSLGLVMDRIYIVCLEQNSCKQKPHPNPLLEKERETIA